MTGTGILRVTSMSEPSPGFSDERILDTMIQLARATRSQRVLVAGSSCFDVYLTLLQRGFCRTATPATCRFPCGQHDVALVAGHHSMQALESLLGQIVPFLNTRAALVIWMESRDGGRGRKLLSVLERLGFRIEAGARCATGFALSARRHACDHIAEAA
jgi:hypothetical protein